MLRKKRILVLALSSLFLMGISSCNTDKPEAPTAEQKQEYLDASAYDSWVYFSFKTNKVIKVLKEYPEIDKDNRWDPAKSTEWDVAFHRQEIRVNGNGFAGGAEIAVTEFTDFSADIDISKLKFVNNEIGDVIYSSVGMPPQTKTKKALWVSQTTEDVPWKYRTNWFDRKNTMKNGWMGQIKKMYKTNQYIFVFKAADGKTLYKVNWTGFMTKKGTGGGVTFRYIKIQ